MSSGVVNSCELLLLWTPHSSGTLVVNIAACEVTVKNFKNIIMSGQDLFVFVESSVICTMFLKCILIINRRVIYLGVTLNIRRKKGVVFL